MELGLSLGDSSKPFVGFLAKNREVPTTPPSNGLVFCMGLDAKSNGRQEQEQEEEEEEERERANQDDEESDEQLMSRSSRNGDDQVVSVNPPVQLDLLPLAPVPRITRPSYNGISDRGSSENMGFTAERGFDVNRKPETTTEAEEEAAGSSPNSAASSFHQLDFCSTIYNRGGGVNINNKRDFQAAGNDVVELERGSSRASDEDENGPKKLRLSKDQSAYLEESFKEHSTLNPKQKVALAKQLNLRPRQVEVWFQNRRARTKLKQTEVDCEYLKRCFETLTEENRRLHKEVQELRVLKSSSNPFHMQLPATTLTMCPSCERTTTSAGATKTIEPTSKSLPFPLSRPRFSPFSQSQSTPRTHQSAAS